MFYFQSHFGFSSPYTPDLIVFLLFRCQIPVSVFFPPPLSLDTLLSPSKPRLLRGAAAPPVKLVRVAVVDTIRMSPPRGMQECQAETETEGCRSCSNNSCARTHTHTYIIFFPYAHHYSSLVICTSS